MPAPQGVRATDVLALVGWLDGSHDLDVDALLALCGRLGDAAGRALGMDVLLDEDVLESAWFLLRPAAPEGSEPVQPCGFTECATGCVLDAPVPYRPVEVVAHTGGLL